MGEKSFLIFLIISLQTLHLSVSLHFIFQFHVWFCFTFTHQIESENPAVTGLSPYLLVWSVHLHNVMTTKLNPARFRMTSGPSQNTPSQFTNPFSGECNSTQRYWDRERAFCELGQVEQYMWNWSDCQLDYIKWFIKWLYKFILLLCISRPEPESSTVWSPSSGKASLD